MSKIDRSYRTQTRDYQWRGNSNV